MKLIALVGLPIFLGACALPPAINIASLAIDGISLAATGKSPGDHALSLVVDQDCALWRAVQQEDVCVDYVVGDGNNVMVADVVDSWRLTPPIQSAATAADAAAPVLIAAAAPVETAARQDGDAGAVVAHARATPAPLEPAATPVDLADLMPVLGGDKTGTPAAATIRTAAFSPASASALFTPASIDVASLGPPRSLLPGARVPAGLAPVPGFGIPDPASVAKILPPEPEGTFLVLGSFRNRVQAELAADGQEQADAIVMPALVNGRTWYRVVAGPFAPGSAKAAKRRFVAAGIKDAWLISL